MNVALRHRTMTEAEFLAWVEPLERRYEFNGREPVAMVGSTIAHGVIQANLLRVMGNLLAGTACRAIGSDNFTRVSGALRLPDVLVIRGAFDPSSRVIANPSVVFEILSASAAHIDRFAKAGEYWGTPSIQHYVMLEQNLAGAVILSRDADKWTREAIDGKGNLDLPAIGVALPLAELYDGLNFPEPDADPDPV